MNEHCRSEKKAGFIKLSFFIAVVGLLPYFNNLSNDWAYDDISYITENAYVSEPGLLGDIFTTTYLMGSGGLHTPLYRPITVASYALNRAVTGLNPGAFHLVNDILHIVNSILLLLLLSRILGRNDLAFLAALLFATHPIHTEAVTNVVGRAELLAFFFSVSSLYVLFRPGRSAIRDYAVAMALFFCALMSKETPAVLPLAVVAILGGMRLRGEDICIRRMVYAGAGYFAVLGLYLLLRAAVIAGGGPVDTPMFADNLLAGTGVLERLPTAMSLVARNAWLLVFPLKLSADYSFNQIPLITSWGHPLALAGAALTAAVLAGTFMSARRSSVVYTGTLFLWLPYLVVGNILFPTGTIMAERAMYLPSAGFCILAVNAVFIITKRLLGRPQPTVWIVFALSLVYSGRIVARNTDWQDNATLFAATVKTSPNSVKTQYNYALSLKKAGNPREAITHYRRAVEIWPEHQHAWFNLGNALRETGDLREAAEAYKRAIDLVSADTGALHNLARTYENLDETEKAVETFERIAALRPGDPSVLMDIGAAWARAGRYDRAKAAFDSVLHVDPQSAGAYSNLGNIAIADGDTLGAVGLYERAVALEPSNPIAHNALLRILIEQNRIAEAQGKAKDMLRDNIPVSAKNIKLLNDTQNEGTVK